MLLACWFLVSSELLRLFADVGEDTTVDIEHVAVDGIGGVGGEEHGRATEF